MKKTFGVARLCFIGMFPGGASARQLGALLLASVLLAASGCSLALKTDPQCTTDADCEARGGQFAGSVCQNQICVSPNGGDPRWSCVGHVKWPAAQGNPVQFSVKIVEILTLKPPPGLAVKACAKLDLDCQAPVSDVVTPDAAGNVTVTLQSGFDGYLDMESDTTIPSYLFPVTPIVESRSHPSEIELLTSTTFSLLTKTAGFSADPTRGTLVILARDCSGTPAAGLSFAADSADDQSKSFYLANGLPSATAKSTDDSGSGGIVNLPAGFAVLNDSLATSGTSIAKTTVQIRSANITYVDLPPTP